MAEVDGRVVAGGGLDRRDAVVKPTRMYARRPPPAAARPATPSALMLLFGKT